MHLHAGFPPTHTYNGSSQFKSLEKWKRYQFKNLKGVKTLFLDV